MRIRDTTRREFIDLMQRTGSVNEATGLLWHRELGDQLGSAELPSARAELQLLSRDGEERGANLPRVVVVNDGTVQDFLAWVVTYFPNHRPLTAYCRVVERSVAESALALMKPPSLGRLEQACAGVILCETASYLDGKQDLRSLPAIAAESTYSFCMSRALALGIATVNADRITEGWVDARLLTRQPRLSADLNSMRSVWAAILWLSNGAPRSATDALGLLPDELIGILVELFEKEDLDRHAVDRLARKIPFLSIYREMDGPREQRVSMLQRALLELTASDDGNDEVRSFLAGFLTAQVGPGTLDYMALLRPYSPRLPSALAWYGLISGLQGNSSVQSFGMGLGRRIIRDVLRAEEFLDLPTCDIAREELSVLRRGSSLDFRTGSRSHVEVEIAPCTNLSLRMNSTTDIQSELFQSSEAIQPELRRLNSEIDAIFGRLENVQNRIGKLAGQEQHPEDRRPRRKMK
jgi:hypothetical protein